MPRHSRLHIASGSAVVDCFNPWSVINYFNNGCEARAFWQSTGSNDIIGEIIAEADKEIYERLTSLINGEKFVTYIDTGVIYPQIKNNPSTIYTHFINPANYIYKSHPLSFYKKRTIKNIALFFDL